MAEVPLPTPTQVPVPSTDIRNAVFAGAKLDEEVTGTGEFYTDRLGVKRLTNTGRNNQFDAAQLDRANRFEQFLLSSGYVFLGDYEDGPFQFSARNQYIRYDNQYYRLNAATDVGFTTTGTDATSFVGDVTHFILMDGDTLRQNLASSEDGLGDSLIAHVQNGVFTGTLSKYLNSAIPIVTPMMFGAAGDGSTNDDDAFSRMLSTINSLTQGVWAIDGMGRIYVLTKTLNADPGKFCMRNMRLDFSSATNFDATTPLYAIIFDATATDYVELDWRCSVYEKLEIIGTGYRTTDNIHPWKFAPSNSLHGLTINDCYIRDFNSGYVFGSNAYLITFNKVRVHRCFTGILTTVDTGEE
ncbi:TPA: hypothetical protein QHC10_004657, partial [Klebsiella quasipneumoniae subsp. similipneumoniae]|nr:hypothetical protein [Klebsiella quasipneumoniae subsp. similipneumoniae]